jgi:glycolate oxidase FAD binding subunit
MPSIEGLTPSATSPSTALATDPVLQRWIDRVQDAARRGQPLCIRGGGTKDFYGGPLLGEPLDTRELRGISAYEPSELVITARAGTPLSEIEAALAAQNQCLAFEPPRLAAGGTVGGMVAAGLAGPSRAAVGGVSDFVLGATSLNGRGEVTSFGGQVMKNVAGYDVSRLLAGSLGVLGVICEVSLKVLPVAPATATLRFEMDEDLALRKLNRWGGQALPLSASAWWQGMLVLRLRGAEAAVNTAVKELGGELVDPDLAQAFWTGLRDQRDEFFQNAQAAVEQGATLWRLSVAQTAPARVVPGSDGPLIEWGGGQRWGLSDAPDQTIHALARQHGGHATAWRGGRRDQGVFTPMAEPLLRIHRELKRAFDPAGIFNPRRLHPEL